jgi:predicted hotdog family 3-hydroxylacyl-ACP dehydratase
VRAELELPISVERLIPHRSPVVLTERLIQFEKLSGTVESFLNEGNLFLRSNGELERCALMEMMAQSFAAVKGFYDLTQGKTIGRGFLVGVKEMSFAATAHKGDRLLIRIEITGETEDFALGRAEVSCRSEVIASGSMMVWLPKEAG